MPIEVLMPALSPTMELGTVVKWYKKEGDSVEAGDVIAEIETDKATMEIEAVEEGILGKILVKAGTQNVRVNSPIALLREEGEAENILEDYRVGSQESLSSPPEKQSSVLESQGSSPEKKEPKKQRDTISTPLSEPRNIGNKDHQGQPFQSTSRIKASPLARKLAKDRGVSLENIQGTGPYGRIIKRDIEHMDTSVGVSSTPGLLGFEEGSYTLVPLNNMRRIVAKRLTESFRDVPHFSLNIDIELDKLLSLRQDFNEAQSIKISINDFIIKASALALQSVPEANASFSEEGVLLHNSSHIAVAVAIEGGLVTPVIRQAEEKSLIRISQIMRELARRAKNKKLFPEDYQGGTFSLSNLGMYGIKSFSSILNPPQGMILSVGRGEKRSVITEEEDIDIRTIMSVTLTCDHRVVDGAVGAQWLSAFRMFIEKPVKLIL